MTAEQFGIYNFFLHFYTKQQTTSESFYIHVLTTWQEVWEDIKVKERQADMRTNLMPVICDLTCFHTFWKMKINAKKIVAYFAERQHAFPDLQPKGWTFQGHYL